MSKSVVMHLRARARVVVGSWAVLGVIAAFAMIAPSGAAAQSSIHKFGELDCNGYSPAQTSVSSAMRCTDIRGNDKLDNANTWGGHFYDNGHYIGHDEPDMTFNSGRTGSGDNVTWTETLPTDPSSAPTNTTPGSDVTHTFELSVAPWFSMAMCDGQAYPLLPCKAQSDSNAPTCVGTQISNCYPGGGSAFMEMQFYPPGFAASDFNGVGCDNTHWCGALNIDSLECTVGFGSCNGSCEEPVNFAFIQKDGVPAGPPSPQQSNVKTFTSNGQTLLMNPGDRISVHMFDAPVPGQTGVSAFEVVVTDLTRGVSGSMQASAANGFQDTSFSDCSGTPFNFQPEYNTANAANIVPWAALQTNISTEFEIGHFEPCTNVTQPSTLTFGPGLTDTTWNDCHGPYENTAPGGDGSKKRLEATDAPCFPAGDTHGGVTAPDTITGCTDFLAGGDLDFEGTSYWPDWPTGTTLTAQSRFPASFVQSLPTTGGAQYPQFFVQTDTALSEATCTSASTAGCTVPPQQAPGAFYPFWSRVGSGSGSACSIEFGNVTTGTNVNDLGGDAGYGTDRRSTLGYDEIESPVLSNNTC